MIRLVGAPAADRLAQAHAAAFDRPWGAGDIEAILLAGGTAALAAESPSGVEGFILVRTAGSEAEILTLAVRPEARRRGVGAALVAAGAGAAAAAGAEVLWLEVAEDNAAAIALYGKSGFDLAGRRKAYYQVAPDRRVDALVMRLALNSAGGSAYSS
jgi:ribosomal-protein-alanine N-acetyltransferase